jgi:predicted phage tail component-like protein
MNKIIWKDTESTEIKGLLISELPPISKPKMRVKETEIDGVDGSKIEELGYESYDKTIKIGLTGKFDINEVIKYFSGAGNVTFSNEPDKYYRARIIDQIDYERLLRYRTANIKFRVQPFKYELDESPVTLTASGKSVTNNGLETSKPRMTIAGSGTIELYVNSLKVFTYTFPEGETEVVVDSEKQDAYLGVFLKNRNMTGDFPILQSGENIISWSGNVTSIVVEPNSRWL